ncbi:response regulator [Ramlibacter sp. RBP-2]|uniref:Chemotaxis protein CheA n=1 Tax=Ramlibacter lithotrophicus TaxID=2606681 RepID=A0A7X6I7N2_9BURK|nr:Hpt domain-containing protein [Ramlibacter lithotrophicus]NKE67706.1 response regulator [Ramlibacter lithotrophicus]
MQATEHDLDPAAADLGPLAWVLEELRKSLAAASAALRRYVRDTGLARGADMASVDDGQLRIARQQLHQAVGALEMVGQAGPAHMLRAMEAAVQKFVERPELCNDASAAKVERAGFALADYLEVLLLGKPASAVALFPQYKDAQDLAGADRIHPADLWSLEWDWRQPASPAPRAALDYAPAVRSRIDTAVLRLMKSGDAGAARDVAEVSLGLAATQAARQPRVFWQVCAGFFEAMALQLLPLDVYVKRAATRVLLQYASLAKGDPAVSDRLVHDLVFFCAQAVPPQPAQAPSLQAVRLAWRLDRHPPVDYATPQFGRFDPALLAQARKRIAATKDTWSALSGGDVAKIKGLVDQTRQLSDSLVKLHPGTAPLAHALASVVEGVVRAGRPPAPELAMEVATAVLYLEAALQDLDPADTQLAGRIARLAERLEAVGGGGQAPALEPWMEELYRRVSDRQTMGSVVSELRSTLSELEKLLDQFFRQPADKGPLRDAPGYLAQMRGVLSVLGLDQAAQAVARMREAVEAIMLAEEPAEAQGPGTFDKLGNNLGALGFLIDMLNYQPALAKKLFVYDEGKAELRPLMGRAVAPAPASLAAVADELGREAAAASDEAGAREQLSAKFTTLAQQATLADQAGVALTARQAAAAVSADGPQAAAAALGGLAVRKPEPAATPAPAEAAGIEEDDLLEIFLEEAGEVVQNGRAALQALAVQPSEVAELTILRRAFHTLKGSSRMVGLAEFGEAAWSMEQVLNTWLADQKPATPELLTLSREAMTGFERWIADVAAHRDGGWKAGLFRGPADALRIEHRLVPLDLPAGSTVEAPPAAASEEQPVVADEPAPAAAETAQALDAPPAEGAALAEEAPAMDFLDLPAPAAAPVVPEPGLPEPSFELPELELPVFEAPAPSGPLERTQLLRPEPEPQPEAAAPDSLPGFDLAPEPAGPLETTQVLRPQGVPETLPAVVAADLMFDVDAPVAVPEWPQAAPPGAEPEHLPGAEPLGWSMPVRAEGPPAEEIAGIDLDALAGFSDRAAAPVEQTMPGQAESDGGLEVGAEVPMDELALDLSDFGVTPQPGGDLPAAPEVVAPQAGQEEEAGSTAAADGPSEACGVEEESGESDEQVKVIGTLRIGIPLYNVYLNEADEWSRRLATEIAEWALELDRPVADSTVGLAHALGGSSATVGFHALSGIARALETALQRAQRMPVGSGDMAQAFTDAAEEIRRLLHQFAAGFLKEPNADVVEALLAIEEPPMTLGADASGFGPSVLPTEPSDLNEPRPEPAGAAAVDAVAPPASFAQRAGLHGDEEAAYESDIDVADAVDPDLFPIFDEEAQELMPQLGGALRQWTARPDNRSARDEVLRALHTLKGSARLAGALRLGEMAHRMESSIESLGWDREFAAGDLEPLLHRFDALQASFDRLRASVAASAAAQQEVAGEPAAAAPAGPAAAPAASAPAAAATTRLAPQRTAAMVRVRSELLDRLVNRAGEVTITRSRLEAEVRQLRASLTDLTGNLDRLRTQLRDIELQAESQMQSRLAQARDSAAGFDPLEFDRFTRVQELTRMMAESVNDVATVQRNLQRTVEATEDNLVDQARQTRELQRDLLRTRMVEFESIADRLYRVVRLASKETGKQVKLDITGGNIEMDRGVLDRMTPAFEHLLRNCVAHGIESPSLRSAAGKEATGTVVIGLHQEGNDVSVEFRDDGAGMDLALIRRKAAAQGLVAQGQELTDAEAASLVFVPGFSTAAQVTELAGRGIGMDVVRAEVNALGGRIETTTATGQGTTFKLVLPLTTAVTQVVMIRSGGLSVGVPANLVEIVRRATAAEVQQAYETGWYELGAEQLPFYWSGALLQSSRGSTEPPGKNMHIVVVRSAAQRIAMHVDEVLGNQEVVVKNLGPQLARLPGLAGMTVLASGAVVLIYNPVALATVYGEQARQLGAKAGEAAPSPADRGATPETAAAKPQIPLVLVVDDSITVRRVTQRLLQREGYRVAMAADGLQALERLAEEVPAVVLSDIEMPRMDGFDLARNIRGDQRLKHLPIIMITSRIAEKHREHAKELGVDHYLGKPYAEDELLSLVRHYSTIAAAA